MSAVITFETIDKSFHCSDGAFGITFSGIFGIYSDKQRLPALWNDLGTKIGGYLYDYWPGRFPDASPGESFLALADIPRSERVEMLRAAEAMLRDLLNGKVDSVFRLDADYRLSITDDLQEFVRLVKQDLAAAQAQPRPERKKRALVYFEATDKVWDPSNEIFGWMFSAVFGLYSDKSRMPAMWNDLRDKIGDYLHEFWPGRFPDASGVRTCHFVFGDFPRPEQLELLRACEAMENDKRGPILGLDPKVRLGRAFDLHLFPWFAEQELAATGINPRSATGEIAKVYFGRIYEFWHSHHGKFGFIFSGILGIYSDASRMPEMWDDLRDKIGDYLHFYWPDRFKFPDVTTGECYFNFDDFPRPEQDELLRAAEAMLRDFRNDRVDPVFRLDVVGRRNTIEALQDFVEYAQQDLNAPDAQ